jgi:hypothetical protein
MKTILRTFILLAAAMLVVGATIALARTSWGSNLLGSGGRPGFEQRLRLDGSGAGNFQRPEGGDRLRQGGFERGEGRGGREGRAGIGSFTWLSLLRNGGILALIVVVYALLDQLFSRRKPKAVVT